MLELKPQKALHYSQAIKKKAFDITKEYCIFEKLDGWYVYIDYINDKWQPLCSSAGRPIPSLEYLLVNFKKLKAPKTPTRFIFEATIPGKLFHELNGILNRKYELAENVVLNLHDVVQIEYYKTQFMNRYRLAYLYIKQLEDVLYEQVKLAQILCITKQHEHFDFYFQNILDKNGEGIILKAYNAGYSFGKRNSDMMKIKEEVTLDLQVIDVLEGQGKYKDTTGTLLCRRKNGVGIQVSGMTDKQREEWWEDKRSILGKIVEVKAMKELPDGTLREPRFKCIRWDK
jgi:hypothetical protein